MLVVKGAPEEIIQHCTYFETDEKNIQKIDAKALEKIRSVYSSLEMKGFRVLGIAWREENIEHTHAVVSDETELTLSGFAAFLDPPKESAKSALSALNDIGLSVDSAVDFAKEAADMILLNHDLRVLYDGVIEGRRTFGNIMKYIMKGTSSNFGNIFSIAGAALFLPFLPMLPTQILLNNFL
ncbi:hypothetical protein ND861_13180 [Leptospira sp. 2 VSF19]|uniref:Magnesium-translocating P-type ATPase n=1 Tax=Leptospira soteropolitanensis TaxID=2950025 RepID=A0AAW5VM12_9LEPT|nr:hypothetical protein [Leptospira soteropolitanensis]MCW7493596.1 hypothetical protein [Leptospira soteropolitanensis]MCW7501195.1 hypothetical protein [Leptospira soteropolitanensis]MCW7523619.1 hypothetical protein [Leptospira soteropolitanensis]MCW7527308.1 hypothetical protein [Leptospira soteropolitanensis]MCW7531165.1 hypothetical protein [Leptospira soteropolitanensis]